MTRAALLPAGSDPFLTAYWLRHYARVWADEVDQLLVRACGVPVGARSYLRELAASLPHTSIVFTEGRTDHGMVLGRLINATKADHLLLMEDDAFIRQRGIIEGIFGRIEAGEIDALGTCRGCASRGLIAAAEERWGPSPTTSTGETGLSLYPALFFGRRADLLKTDRHFGAWGWHAGDTVPGLRVKAQEGWSADTFVATSWQLRAMGLRIEAQPAYRTDYVSMWNWTGAPWFHVGSLSVGYGSSFGVERDEVYWAHVAHMQTDIDWIKRLGWFQRAWDCWDGGIPEVHAAHGESLSQLITDSGYNPELIAHWRSLFDPLISWPERP